MSEPQRVTTRWLYFITLVVLFVLMLVNGLTDDKPGAIISLMLFIMLLWVYRRLRIRRVI